VPEQQKKPVARDQYFCPYCFQMTFEPSAITGDWVFCEVCGVDVECKDLVKQ